MTEGIIAPRSGERKDYPDSAFLISIRQRLDAYNLETTPSVRRNIAQAYGYLREAGLGILWMTEQSAGLLREKKFQNIFELGSLREMTESIYIPYFQDRDKVKMVQGREVMKTATMRLTDHQRLEFVRAMNLGIYALKKEQGNITHGLGRSRSWVEEYLEERIMEMTRLLYSMSWTGVVQPYGVQTIADRMTNFMVRYMGMNYLEKEIWATLSGIYEITKPKV
ncbi:hypothetical protein HGB07_04710 [Candidatus Roizmanbacteria bacterium]|nr:hypothetical protein [Candidatus Roizmanbacteria bacterium]